MEIFFRDQQLIVYEIRLIAIREVSPPFGEDRASTAVEKTILSTETHSTKFRTQITLAPFLSV